MILVRAASRSQASVVLGYVRAFLRGSPLLSRQVESETGDEIRIKGGIVIGVHSNSFRTVRGRTLLACIFDEAAYWRDETTAVPDVETYTACLPALATTGGMLIGISSAYRRAGLLYQKSRDHFGRDHDDVLVVRGGTIAFNPTIDTAVIERAREADPIAARAEWDGEFRDDIGAFLDDALIESAIDRGRPLELAPRGDLRYYAFADMSGGRHDASCLAIGHREGERVVIDLVRGVSAPHNPASVTVEFATLAKEYHCDGGRITGDAFGGEWCAGAFREAGIEYVRSERPKSTLYLEGLPLFARGAISIPDHPPLVRELRLLERRVTRSGKDSIDHNPSGHDDNANVVFGVMWACRPRPRREEPPLAVLQVAAGLDVFGQPGSALLRERRYDLGGHQ